MPQPDGEKEGQRDGETEALSSSLSRSLPQFEIPYRSPSPVVETAEKLPKTDSADRPHETRNFWLLIIYQVVLATGWISKTESSIMRAASDALDPTGLARGWLQPLNRFGQGIPPVGCVPSSGPLV